ncbi:MAG: hypothetical protein ACREX8_16785, partial [Gammaproteobacteria bacterium]
RSGQGGSQEALRGGQRLGEGRSRSCDDSARNTTHLHSCRRQRRKSSIGGAAFRAFGADYYNPDEAARVLMGATPD